ncbi:MAG: hypothetical protein IBX60_01215 [Candidatus Aminicenantes bacterium]|nr:hypothetical protein [Candidatus Aminicenantes bacterium]
MGQRLDMDKAEFGAYMAGESLVFGGRVHLRWIGSENRYLSCRLEKNMASSPLKNYQRNKRRHGCHNRGFRLS